MDPPEPGRHVDAGGGQRPAVGWRTRPQGSPGVDFLDRPGPPLATSQRVRDPFALPRGEGPAVGRERDRPARGLPSGRLAFLARGRVPEFDRASCCRRPAGDRRVKTPPSRPSGGSPSRSPLLAGPTSQSFTKPGSPSWIADGAGERLAVGREGHALARSVAREDPQRSPLAASQSGRSCHRTMEARVLPSGESAIETHAERQYPLSVCRAGPPGEVPDLDRLVPARRDQGACRRP